MHYSEQKPMSDSQDKRISDITEVPEHFHWQVPLLVQIPSP